MWLAKGRMANDELETREQPDQAALCITGRGFNSPEHQGKLVKLYKQLWPQFGLFKRSFWISHGKLRLRARVATGAYCNIERTLKCGPILAKGWQEWEVLV